MKKRGICFKLTLAGIFTGLLCLVPAAAQDSIVKNTRILLLGATEVKINVYEKKGDALTFVAPHYNEQAGRRIAKELIEKKGGRLVEIESVDESGNAARRLMFSFGGKSYAIDPNRIFTENGRSCGGVPPEIIPAVKTFADSFLKIILPENGNRLRAGERFLVAVHNNGDVDDSSKSNSARENDLTAFSFVKYSKGAQLLHGKFQEQSDGAYLSNVETDEDNFFFLSTPAFLGFFAERGFNAVVQKSAAKLQTKNCAIDDGSLSVFSGQRNLSYINVEADAANGSFRQRQMLEAVYELLEKNSNSKFELAAGDDKAGDAGKK